MAPTRYGIFVNGLPNLPIAGGNDWTLSLMKIQTRIIPFEIQEFQDFAGPSFLIGNQLCIRYVENLSRRKHLTPMRHEALVLAVVVRQVRQIHSELQICREFLKITG